MGRNLLAGNSWLSSASSETLKAKACELLGECSYLEVRRIQCTVRENLLVLQGNVSSYYVSQVAQNLVQNLDGVSIRNELRVVSREMSHERASPE